MFIMIVGPHLYTLSQDRRTYTMITLKYLLFIYLNGDDVNDRHQLTVHTAMTNAMMEI